MGSGDRLPAGSVASEVGGEEEKNDKEDKEEDENGSSESSSDEEPDLTPLERAKQHIQVITVGAKINFPFPFLTQQEKRSRMDRAVGVPCLLYALRIFF